MKTIKQITFALLLLAVTMISCKKDEILTSSTNHQMNSKTTKQLLAFRDNLKLKNSSTMPLDSATWYLEGLLNFENANNNHQFDGLEFFYDTLMVYTSGSELTLSELNELYAHFNTTLETISKAQTIPDFAYDALDITIINSGLKNGELVVVMSISAGSNLIGNYYAFGPTDYWSWGFQGGKCGPYAGQGGTSDASQQLNYRFNHPVALPSPGYYTGVETISTTGDQFPDAANPGPYCDYKIFLYDATNTGIWPCLSPDELNYYLSTMPYIINAKRPEIGMSYINVSVTALFFPNGTSIYFHIYDLRYGYYHEYDKIN